MVDALGLLDRLFFNWLMFVYVRGLGFLDLVVVGPAVAKLQIDL